MFITIRNSNIQFEDLLVKKHEFSNSLVKNKVYLIEYRHFQNRIPHIYIYSTILHKKDLLNFLGIQFSCIIYLFNYTQN